MTDKGHGRSRFCEEVAPVLGGDGGTMYCCLRAGHTGDHDGERQGVTCKWDAAGRIIEAVRLGR